MLYLGIPTHNTQTTASSIAIGLEFLVIATRNGINKRTIFKNKKIRRIDVYLFVLTGTMVSDTSSEVHRQADIHWSPDIFDNITLVV